MSKLTIDTTGKKVSGKIEDVVFAYVKLQSGSTKYQSKDIEYTVDVIVDKATAKEFKKLYPKNSVKDFDNAEFTTKFKIEPPFPTQDEQFVLKLKAAAQLKAAAPAVNLEAGDMIPYEWSSRPKVFVPVEGGVEDITLTVLIANGSKGDVAFTVNSNDFGTFPQLTGILVKDLIEYEAAGGSSSAFGTVVGGFKSDTSKVKQMPSVQPDGDEGFEPTQAQSPTAEGMDLLDDPQIPF
jgi:hypothetical protein